MTLLDTSTGEGTENVLKIPDGLLYIPAEAHKFRFTIKSDIDCLIPKQVISVNTDYVNREITVIIQQPRSVPALQAYLLEQCQHPQIISITTMTGHDMDPEAMTLDFHVEIKEHKYFLTYEADDIAQHVIVFKILE